MEPVIQTHDLTKHYNKVVGIEELTLTVNKGEIFGFLGPNGAGKTTTIRILVGLLRPTAGYATLLGMDTWKDSVSLKSYLGFIPDFPALYENLRGMELLDYLGRLNTQRDPVLREELCERLELSRDDLDRRIKGYSRGMRQKLAIIQALQHDPEILILDEPTEGLDPLMQNALFQILTDFQARGSTIFFSSHILPDVEKVCQRVGIIRQGKLVTVSNVEELRQEKVRTMKVVLTQEAPDGVFSVPGVMLIERNGRDIRLTVKGDINPLLRELAKLEIEDMIFEQTHLEDIFMGFYRQEE
ncbi:MAG: ABC transporter ATP-binding protein [Chloroflexi bacterium]|nr:ABC transporter ATP-binding protein [Chloroflexota bacterium]